MNPHAVFVPPPGPPPVPAPLIPADLVARLDPILTTAEQITGLSRREIFLQLLKAGMRGNGISGVLEGLLGQKPAPEAKFIRYVKIIAIWVPVFIFLMGLSLIGVYVFAKFMLTMFGGL
jgi:hypothetical protein